MWEGFVDWFMGASRRRAVSQSVKFQKAAKTIAAYNVGRYVV